MQQDYSVYFVFKIKFDFREILLRVELQKQMNFEPEMLKKKKAYQGNKKMGWNEKNPQDQIQYNNFLFWMEKIYLTIIIKTCPKHKQQRELLNLI